MTPEISLVLHPQRTYTHLVGESRESTWARVAVYALLVLTIIASTLGIAATRRITAGLLMSLALCWLFVVLAQLALATALIGTAGTRRVTTMRRALELWFMGHAPWSLWLLGMAAWTYVGPPRDPTTLPVLATLIVVLGLRFVMVYGYCATVLGSSRGRALLQVLAHQATVGVLIVLYAAWAVGAWARFG